MESLRENITRDETRQTRDYGGFRHFVSDLGFTNRETVSISLREAIAFSHIEPSYTVNITTGSGGSKSKAWIKIVYEGGSRYKLVELYDPFQQFDPGSERHFSFVFEHFYGGITEFYISTEALEWFVEKVIFYEPTTRQRLEFQCHRWLSVYKDRAPDCARELRLFTDKPPIADPSVPHKCQDRPSTGGPPTGGSPGTSSGLKEYTFRFVLNPDLSHDVGLRTWIGLFPLPGIIIDGVIKRVTIPIILGSALLPGDKILFIWNSDLAKGIAVPPGGTLEGTNLALFFSDPAHVGKQILLRAAIFLPDDGSGRTLPDPFFLPLDVIYTSK